jgi:hypothetical protein
MKRTLSFCERPKPLRVLHIFASLPRSWRPRLVLVALCSCREAARSALLDQEKRRFLRDMSQRRAAAAKVSGGGAISPSESTTTIIEEKASIVAEENAVPQGSLVLETEQEKEPLNSLSSLDERYDTEKHHNLRVKHWRESPWACGLTEPSWEAERSSHKARQKFGHEDLNPDSSGCLCCSAMICPFLGAGRVGNMAVLSQSTEWVEQVEEDEETGEEKIKRFTRPKLNIVLGP